MTKHQTEPSSETASPDMGTIPGEVDEYLKTDPQQEVETLDRLRRKNRKRILIPLAVLLALWAVLSLFGDPLAPKENSPSNSVKQIP